MQMHSRLLVFRFNAPISISPCVPVLHPGVDPQYWRNLLFRLIPDKVLSDWKLCYEAKHINILWNSNLDVRRQWFYSCAQKNVLISVIFTEKWEACLTYIVPSPQFCLNLCDYRLDTRILLRFTTCPGQGGSKRCGAIRTSFVPWAKHFFSRPEYRGLSLTYLC